LVHPDFVPVIFANSLAGTFAVAAAKIETNIVVQTLERPSLAPITKKKMNRIVRKALRNQATSIWQSRNVAGHLNGLQFFPATVMQQETSDRQE
jgi:hypothetical protein